MTSDNQRESAPVDEQVAAPTGGHPGSSETVVAVADVSKTFGTVKALQHVDLVVRRGTVHALVGENGSGKSTLTKVIAGAHQPDSGKIWLEGELIDEVTPRTALDHGVRVIYQDFALFPNMTIAENIGFDGSGNALGKVPRAENNNRARKALETLGLTLSPDTPLRDLSTAERQLVAIARAVSSEGRIILMDEPTAALTQSEIDSFLDTVRSLAEQGISFVFISHKLREVVAIADDVTVIRDGKIVDSGPADHYDQERISFLMTGTEVVNERRTVAEEPERDALLKATGLSLGDVFRDIDVELHAGRVVGLSGLVGCGKIEIGLALAGLIKPEKGCIQLSGRELKEARSEGKIQYVPDDRLTEGLFLEWTIADNMAASSLAQTRSKGRLLGLKKITELGRTWQERLRIKAPDVDVPASSLSGGNQQRVLLARCMAPRPSVIILNNPTVGVDVGSRADIHDLIRELADSNVAVLLISDEPAELLSVCDEIAFVFDGTITQRAAAEELTEDDIVDINGKGHAA